LLIQKLKKHLFTIVNMFSLHQEIEVWYIIPAVRKELAKFLVSEYALSYEKTGKILGISKAAVSQYISNKRANKITLSSQVCEEIVKSGKILYENPKMGVHEIQKILTFMKTQKATCEVCKQFNKEVLEYCNSLPNY